MTLSQCLSVFTVLGALTLSAPAWADIPPEDVCLASNVGEVCNNASLPMARGESNGPGVCREAMCTRSTPNGPVTYQCYRCVASDDGGGGRANEAGASNTSGSAAGGATDHGSGGATAGGSGNAVGSSSAGAANSKSGSDDGGCSLSQAPRGGGPLGAALIALGLTFAGIRRRRSPTS